MVEISRIRIRLHWPQWHRFNTETTGRVDQRPLISPTSWLSTPPAASFTSAPAPMPVSKVPASGNHQKSPLGSAVKVSCEWSKAQLLPGGQRSLRQKQHRMGSPADFQPELRPPWSPKKMCASCQLGVDFIPDDINTWWLCWAFYPLNEIGMIFFSLSQFKMNWGHLSGQGSQNLYHLHKAALKNNVTGLSSTLCQGKRNITPTVWQLVFLKWKRFSEEWVTHF